MMGHADGEDGFLARAGALRAKPSLRREHEAGRELPQDYSLQYPYGFTQSVDTAELQSIDAQMRTAFAAAQVPLSHVQPLVTALVDAADFVGDMSADQSQAHNEAVVAAVGRIFPDADAAFTKARDMARSLGKATFERLRDIGSLAGAGGDLRACRLALR